MLSFETDSFISDECRSVWFVKRQTVWLYHFKSTHLIVRVTITMHNMITSIHMNQIFILRIQLLFPPFDQNQELFAEFSNVVDVLSKHLKLWHRQQFLPKCHFWWDCGICNRIFGTCLLLPPSIHVQRINSSTFNTFVISLLKKKTLVTFTIVIFILLSSTLT